MEKRTIIAIILSLVILVFYQEVIMKRILKQVPSTQVVEKENKIYKSEKKDFNSNTSKKTPIKERTNFENKKSDRVKQEVIKNINEKLITIENDLFILTFSNRGGAVQRCILKKYFETVHKRKNVVLFDRIKGYEIENEITFDNFFIKKDEIYNVNISDKELYVENKPINIVFTYSNNQLTVKKIYTVFPNKYEVKLTYEILNKTGKNLNVINKTFFYRTKKERKSRYQFEGPCFLVDGVLKEVPVKKLEKEPYRSYSKNLKWYAYSEVYFISVILKKDEFFDKAKTYLKGKDVVIEGEKKFPVRVNENYSDINYLYFGPKKYDILKSYHAGLERSIDYGIFDFLAKPLVMLLNFFYKYVHNYGIAILLLTLLIKLLFYPLTQKSYESMKKMKDLQPHLQTLKEKYKNDKAKLNQAIMELYKKHKVNPFGGCLPILIQIPVFFALYKALLASIELRHAPFIKYLPFTDKLWLIDLSAKDPYYITPILMGLSMFIQQKMTPTGGDAMQEKLMYIMPIVLTFLFLNFPSGLVVYWLANNVLSIIQQYYVNKKMS